MKFKLFLLTFICACSLSTFAQSTEVHTSALFPADPESVGVSPIRLAKIENMLKEAVETNQVPGVVALVVRDGRIVFHKAFGAADPTGRELQKDDIFRLASQTKAITATAVMMLWEEGKFRLDDPISQYIPEFSEPEVLLDFNEEDSSYTTTPSNKEITIRHLLTHTSGLGYGIIDSDPRFRKIYQKAGITDLFTTEDVSIEENVKKLAKLPLHHLPGDKYTYSEGLDVLGYFVEVISGIPFDEFLQERIFEPLGMKDTGFYLPQEKASRLVAVQHTQNNNWEAYSNEYYDTDYPISGAARFYSGGAGLSGTAKDYALFLQMFLNDGELNGTRLLSRTTVNIMMGNQTGELWGDGNKYYGLSFGIITPKGEARGGEGSRGTFDWGGYFNTQYFADPEENIIGVLLKQTQGPTNDQTGWKFRQMVMASIND